MTKEEFVHGSGKRKTLQQRRYEKVEDCCKKLKSYAQKISTCGDCRNSYSKPVKGNQYGRTEEFYQCEDCSGCTHKENCFKANSNRVVRINKELSAFHREVLENLNSLHDALLCMNRSIQAEGAFGEIKWNKGYKRLYRHGIEGVILELGLISCGFNLHKFHLKRSATLLAT